MDKPHETQPQDEPPIPEPSEMLAFLLESQREAINGETVALEDVLADLSAAAEELEHRLVHRPA